MKSLNDEKIFQQKWETEKHNQTLPYKIQYPNYQSPDGVVWSSKPINTQQITQLLQKSKVGEEYHTKSLEELTLDNFNLDKLNLQETLAESSERASFTKKEDPQEESSTQAHIQIPPKQN